MDIARRGPGRAETLEDSEVQGRPGSRRTARPPTAYIPEWEVRFEPRPFRTRCVSSQESGRQERSLNRPEPWSGTTAHPRDLGAVSQTSHFSPVAAVLA